MITSPTFWPVLLPKTHPHFDQDFRAGYAIMSILSATAFRSIARCAREDCQSADIEIPLKSACQPPLSPTLGGGKETYSEGHPRTPGSILLHRSDAHPIQRPRSTFLGDSRNAEGLRPPARPDRHSYPEQPWKFTFTPRANSPQARSPLDSSSSATSAKPSPSNPLLVCLPVGTFQPRKS